jgi:ribosomal protein S27AE
MMVDNIVNLRKWQGKPRILIDSILPKLVIDAIDKATSYKIQNAEHIDNQMYICPKCGWWKLTIHADSDFCKRCGTQCNLGLWDCIIRLLSQTRQGKYWFPQGLLDTVENTLASIGYSTTLLGGSPEPSSESRNLDLTWSGWKPRKHQNEAINRALEKLEHGRGAILEMSVGAGKTTTALMLIQKFGVNTLIIVHKKNLMEQWNNAIKESLKWEPELYGDNNKDIGPITIAMIQSISAAKSNFPYHIFNFVVWDECLNGETLIETEKGEIKIKEIVEQKMKVKVKTHTGELKQIKDYKKIKTTKQMVRVSYKGGEIECTEDHKFLTARGWIKAKDLIPSKDVLYRHGKAKTNF